MFDLFSVTPAVFVAKQTHVEVVIRSQCMFTVFKFNGILPINNKDIDQFKIFFTNHEFATSSFNLWKPERTFLNICAEFLWPSVLWTLQAGRLG